MEFLTDKGQGWTRRKSQRSLSAVLGIRDSCAGQNIKSWPVADKRLTTNEKSICLVAISVPDICFFASLSKGYPPRSMGSAGVRLTDLQAETIGRAFRAILFPGNRSDVPLSFVWRGCRRAYSAIHGAQRQAGFCRPAEADIPPGRGARGSEGKMDTKEARRKSSCLFCSPNRNRTYI